MSPRMRINRFLASAGIGSRRKCEELIREGRVRINGEAVPELARFIDTESDTVTLDGKPVGGADDRLILVINKPGGVLSTVSDDRGRKTVIALAREKGFAERLFPVGRLDIDTTGILLLTNDGDLAYRLTHPRFKIEKRYVVTVEGIIEDETVRKLETGIDLGDYVSHPLRRGSAGQVQNLLDAGDQVERRKEKTDQKDARRSGTPCAGTEEGRSRRSGVQRPQGRRHPSTNGGRGSQAQERDRPVMKEKTGWILRN